MDQTTPIGLERPRLAAISVLIVSGVLFLIGEALIVRFWPMAKWQNVPFHTFVETLGAILGLALAGLFWFQKRAEAHYPWIIAGLVGMAILDIFHAFSNPGNVFVWLHSLAILVGGFLFVLSLLSTRVKMSILTLLAAVVLLTGAVGAASFITPQSMPLMVSQGIFTTAAKTINMLGGVFFLAVSLYLMSLYMSSGKTEQILLANFCILSGITGLFFQISQLWDFHWWFWHFARVTGYAIVFGYVAISAFSLKRNASNNQPV